MKLTGVAAMDIVECLPNWSDRNLRWLVDYISRLNDNAGQATYTVIHGKARALRDERATTGQRVADKSKGTGLFMLAGVEGHDFGRCDSITDCHELAARMGLGIVPGLDAGEYFGHAMVPEV